MFTSPYDTQAIVQDHDIVWVFGFTVIFWLVMTSLIGHVYVFRWGVKTLVNKLKRLERRLGEKEEQKKSLSLISSKKSSAGG